LRRLWIEDWNYEGEPFWLECAVDRVTPKFVFCGRVRLLRDDLAELGYAPRYKVPRYCIDAFVPADARRVTLEEQAAEWKARKADILEAEAAHDEAERVCMEAYRASDAVFTAALKGNRDDDAIRLTGEAFDKAVEARDAAWKRLNRYTIFERDRAKADEGRA
jgi:hypothetical protein